MRITERLLYDAFESCAQLKAMLRASRQQRALSRVIGAPVDAAVSRAMARADEAVQEIVAAHRGLDKLAPHIGIDPRAYGDSPDYPDAVGTSGAAADGSAAAAA